MENRRLSDDISATPRSSGASAATKKTIIKTVPPMIAIDTGQRAGLGASTMIVDFYNPSRWATSSRFHVASPNVTSLDIARL